MFWNVSRILGYLLVQHSCLKSHVRGLLHRSIHILQEVEGDAIRVISKVILIELFEVVLEELLVETFLDVFLIFFYRFLLLLDEIVFGSSLARGAIGGELGYLDFVLGGDLLKRFYEDVSAILVADDIHV